MNIICTICSDPLNQAESIYVTKCGHIFHLNCLSQWISRSKSCPQCRNKVTERCMFRIYPTVSGEITGATDTVETIQTKLDDAQLEIRQRRADLKAAKDKLKRSEEAMKEFEKTVKRVEEKLISKVSAISALTEQINYLKVENKFVNKLKEENDGMKKKLHTLNGLHQVLNSVTEDVETMLQGYPDLKTIALFATALKRALLESEIKKKEYRDRLYAAKQHIAIEESKNTDMQVMIVQLEDNLANTARLLEEYKKSSSTDEPSTSKKKSSPKKRTSSDNEEPTSSRPKRQKKNSTEEVPSTSTSPRITRSSTKASTPEKPVTTKKTVTPKKGGNSDKSEREKSDADKDVMEPQVIPGFDENVNLCGNGSVLNDHNIAAANEAHNDTKNKMLSQMDESFSPYLLLKQGATALRAFNRYPEKLQAEKDKAAGFTILPWSRSKENHSIFNNRDRDLVMLPNNETDRQTDISYDGLGGHSKLDEFPKSRPVLKNCIPKLTAKHKLKRPVASGSQDITKMFEKIVDK